MPSRSPIAAGAPLVLAIFAGVLIGARFNQPSLGMVAGIATGAAIAIVVWLVDRRRIGR